MNSIKYMYACKNILIVSSHIFFYPKLDIFDDYLINQKLVNKNLEQITSQELNVNLRLTAILKVQFVRRPLKGFNALYSTVQSPQKKEDPCLGQFDDISTLCPKRSQNSGAFHVILTKRSDDVIRLLPGHCLTSGGWISKVDVHHSLTTKQNFLDASTKCIYSFSLRTQHCF